MKPKKKSRDRKRGRRRLGNEELYRAIVRLMTQRKLYLDKNCSRAMLARELMTNRTYVSRALNAKGMTYAQFVNSFRVQHAIGLLSRPEHAATPLGDIAEMSGFSCVELMNRYLKKSAGLTARALRNRLTA